MPSMNDQHIARLEARLERLVEGAFANLFGKKIRAQDIALQLARAMEDGARIVGTDPRPLAPDQYVIHVSPEVQKHLTDNQPNLIGALREYIVDLATSAGYRLSNVPVIKILSDARVEQGKLQVTASHTNRPENSTAVMQRVAIPDHEEPLRNPQLIIDGRQPIPLAKGIVNIGRHRDNDVIVEDRFVSRHHVQLRLRFGAYTLFDIESQSGTFVNEVRVREHRLQAGDVIRLGRTRIVYYEDDPLDDSQAGSTQGIDPVQPG